MDVNSILTHLINGETCFPAIKLAWDSQIVLQDLTKIPKIFPSDYIRELQLNTLERHNLLCHQQRKLEFWKPGFEVTVVPCVVFFQKYNTGEKHSLTLNIRNISKQLQKITLLMHDSNVFELDVNSTRITSFAPGMTVTATVNFNPEDDRDYYHKLIIVTKKSRFAVPIVGIGGRGVLDLPDQFDFKKVAVKYLKTITTSVSNIGTKCARFTFTAKGPFRVTPEKGVVAPQDSFILSLSFISETQASFQGHLHVKYENGEEVYSTIRAEAVNISVCLCTPRITFEDTYLGFKSKEIIRITNCSNTKVDFSWKKYFSKSEFEQHNNRKSIIPHGFGDAGQDQIGLDGAGVSNAGRPEPAFVDKTFVIEPSVGKVQPCSYKDVQVFFSPTAAESYVTEIFCDLTGKEDRLPLHVSGRGLGPKFRFGFDVLDFGIIFLGGGHTYEIPVENTSQIKGTVVFEAVSGLMPDVNTKVEPEKLELAPGQFGAFYMFFNCSGAPREFFEELRFRVPVTNDVICVSARGTIKFPGMHFSVDKLDFGDVSYGFPKTEHIVLVNDSLNPVDIVLKLNKDGNERALNYEQIISSFGLEQFDFPVEPQEFSIEPTTFQLGPRGFQRLKITLLSNNYGEYNRKILVCIVDNNEPIHDLVVIGQCPPPSLVNSRTDIVLKDCYVGSPYPDKFEIYNPTDLSGVYCIVPVPNQRVKFQSSDFVGVLKSRNITTIPFTTTTLVSGETKSHLEVYLVGKTECMLELSVKTLGIPSKLDVSQRSIDFGDISLLETVRQEFEIINESPLALPYSTVLAEGGRAGDHWAVDPPVGTLEPHSRQTVYVDLTLQEVGPHNALIRIATAGMSSFIDVRLKAVGSGSSLLFKPAFNDPAIVDFGAMFTGTVKTFTYEITNQGHKIKMLDWRSSDDDPPQNPPPPVAKEPKKPVELKKPLLPKKTNVPKKVLRKRKKSVIEIEPAQRLLGPGETMTVTFTTRCSTARAVDENFILWVFTPKKETPQNNTKNKYAPSHGRKAEPIVLPTEKPTAVKKVKFIGLFDSPNLSFSKKALIFRIDASPIEQTFEEKGSFKVENTWHLPISAIFHAKFPFTIVMKGMPEENGMNEWSHIFEPKESLIMTINFDGRHLRKDKGSLYFDSYLDTFYEGNPEAERIPLRGEVHFPSVTIDKKSIDFGVVVNGTEAVDEFSVSNTCNFCLTYKWYIKPLTTEVESSTDQNSEEEKKTPSPLTQLRSGVSGLHVKGSPPKAPFNLTKAVANMKLGPSTSLCDVLTSNDVNVILNNPRQDPNESRVVTSGSTHSVNTRLVETANENDLYGITKSSQSLDNYDDSIQYLRKKMYRSRMMEMIGMHDPEKELEDELMYFQQNKEEPQKIGPVAISELMDIVPMAGVIQAGQTQKFTCVFYGHPDIRFKTVAICYLEGGTSKYLTITGESTTASLAVMPRTISLGLKLFSDTITRRVGVKNVGRVELDAKVTLNFGELEEGMGKLEVTPSSVALLPGTHSFFNITYVPGQIGEFKTDFLIQARYCGSSVITLTGESVYPVVSVMLPRNLDCLPLIFVLSTIAGLVDRFVSPATPRGSVISFTTEEDYEEEHEYDLALNADEGSLEGVEVSSNPISPLPTRMPSHQIHQQPTQIWHEEPGENFDPTDPGKILSGPAIHTSTHSNPRLQELLDNTPDTAVKFRANSIAQPRHSIPGTPEWEEDEMEIEIESDEELLQPEEEDDYEIDFDEWEWVRGESLPSVYLISDVIERALITNYVNKMYSSDRRSLNKVMSKHFNLKIDLPEYVLNLGDVIAGVEVAYPIEVGNPGVIPTSVTLSETELAPLRKKGITINPRELLHLGVGSIGVLNLVALFPASQGSDKGAMEPLDAKIYLQIKSGPRIPIAIKARIYYPLLSISTEFIDFGTLRPTTFKTISFDINNMSPVSIVWAAVVEDPNKRPMKGKFQKRSKAASGNDGAFQIWPVNGLIAAGQREVVQVSFNPAQPGQFLHVLHMRHENSPIVYDIKLKGTMEESVRVKSGTLQNLVPKKEKKPDSGPAEREPRKNRILSKTVKSKSPWTEKAVTKSTKDERATQSRYGGKETKNKSPNQRSGVSPRNDYDRSTFSPRNDQNQRSSFSPRNDNSNSFQRFSPRNESLPRALSPRNGPLQNQSQPDPTPRNDCDFDYDCSWDCDFIPAANEQQCIQNMESSSVSAITDQTSDTNQCVPK